MPRPAHPLPLSLLGLAALGAFGLLACPSGCASAPNVPAEVALDTYSAAPFAEVLAAAVTDAGLIDYSDITNDPENPDSYADLDGKLDIYLDALARFGPESTPELFPTEDDQLAYYLNAYNAIMIRLWLDNGARTAAPTDKVQWLTWFTVNQWKIDRRNMSLDYLEQRLIRPTFKESRIHAALVCGAVDCPPLWPEPFAGDRLDEQLDAVSRAWLTDPADDGLRIDDDGRVYLSAIFGWYRDDYRAEGGLEAMLEKYLDDSDPRKAPALDALRNNRVKFMGYDWTINDAANAVARGN
ncbi:MAG: DUF547 domain-containing protein [Planctomycetota bacterium]